MGAKNQKTSFKVKPEIIKVNILGLPPAKGEPQKVNATYRIFRDISNPEERRKKYLICQLCGRAFVYNKSICRASVVDCHNHKTPIPPIPKEIWKNISHYYADFVRYTVIYNHNICNGKCKPGLRYKKTVTREDYKKICPFCRGSRDLPEWAKDDIIKDNSRKFADSQLLIEQPPEPAVHDSFDYGEIIDEDQNQSVAMNDQEDFEYSEDQHRTGFDPEISGGNTYIQDYLTGEALAGFKDYMFKPEQPEPLPRQQRKDQLKPSITRDKPRNVNNAGVYVRHRETGLFKRVEKVYQCKRQLTEYVQRKEGSNVNRKYKYVNGPLAGLPRIYPPVDYTTPIYLKILSNDGTPDKWFVDEFKTWRLLKQSKSESINPVILTENDKPELLSREEVVEEIVKKSKDKYWLPLRLPGEKDYRLSHYEAFIPIKEFKIPILQKSPLDPNKIEIPIDGSSRPIAKRGSKPKYVLTSWLPEEDQQLIDINHYYYNFYPLLDGPTVPKVHETDYYPQYSTKYFQRTPKFPGGHLTDREIGWIEDKDEEKQNRIVKDRKDWINKHGKRHNIYDSKDKRHLSLYAPVFTPNWKKKPNGEIKITTERYFAQNVSPIKPQKPETGEKAENWRYSCEAFNKYQLPKERKIVRIVNGRVLKWIPKEHWIKWNIPKKRWDKFAAHDEYKPIKKVKPANVYELKNAKEIPVEDLENGLSKFEFSENEHHIKVFGTVKWKKGKFLYERFQKQPETDLY